MDQKEYNLAERRRSLKIWLDYVEWQIETLKGVREKIKKAIEKFDNEHTW